MRSRPELLSPAGDFERLEMALHYGADAVYLAGQRYGMRASAGNFSDDELRSAVQLAHSMERRVYVTCNTLPRENELQTLPDFLSLLQDCGADAVIVADLGVMQLCRKYAPDVALHVSTQLGVVNSATANMLYDMGAKCVVLARELSLDEIATIRANTPKDLKLEAFVHGAMCVSFSGRCVLSNYMTGRDANRGECAQPCRWKYALMEEKRPGEYFPVYEDEDGAHILNSRDMCMIEHLPDLIAAGVDSLKIEGRMKSAYYTAAVTNAYRHALDEAIDGRPLSPVWRDEVMKLSHREYCTGFYFGQPGQYTGDSIYFRDAMVCAVVEHTDENGEAVLTQRNRFFEGDVVELVTNDAPPQSFVVQGLRDSEGQAIDAARHPMMGLKLQLPRSAQRLSILRKPVDVEK